MMSLSNRALNAEAWYLVHCQPRRESLATHILTHLYNLHVYLPEYKVRTSNGMRVVPFFPGYLFVRVNLQITEATIINSCPGVINLVSFDGDPQVVEDDVIDGIIERLHYIHICDIANFFPGDQVRIKKEGALQDLEIIFLGPTSPTQRVWVLLNFLGRQKKVHVDITTIEKVPESSVKGNNIEDYFIPRKRYTRGKGRKIRARV